MEINDSPVIGPVTNSAFTSGDAGVWSYTPSSAGNHRFDNFSVTVLGGGQQRASKVLALRVLPQIALTPAPNQVFRLYYYAGGARLAVRVLTGASGANDLYFLHSDHLGSTSLTTDINANVVGQQRYMAYGEPRNPSGTLHTDRRFTGQREETNLGSLYDFNARMYSPLIGRFVSADTIVPGAGNPQALNRYSYVYNQPTAYVDPSGHCVTNDVEQTRNDWFDCTVDELSGLDWGVRIWWLRNLVDTMGAGNWFDDILGAVGLLASDPDFKSLDSWASYADAGVLQAIQNGYRMNTNQTIIGGYHAWDSAAGWHKFLVQMRDRDVSRNTRIETRLTAEQGGVNYGWALAYDKYQNADPYLQDKIEGLKFGTDLYRSQVPIIRSAPVIGAAVDQWALFDPRTSWSVLQYGQSLLGPLTVVLASDRNHGEYPKYGTPR